MQLLKRKKGKAPINIWLWRKNMKSQKKRKEMEVKEDEENVLGAIEA